LPGDLGPEFGQSSPRQVGEVLVILMRPVPDEDADLVTEAVPIDQLPGRLVVGLATKDR